MKTALLLALISTTSFAQVEVSPDCQESLKAEVLKSELAKIEAEGDVLASEFKAEFGLSGGFGGDEIIVGVTLTESIEGRNVSYGKSVSKTDAANCRIKLERNNDGACRYSVEGKPFSLTEIRGFKFRYVRTVRPFDRLSSVTEMQVKNLLGTRGEEKSAAELIREGTSGDKLAKAILTLPNGRELVFLGARQGQYAFGGFFPADSAEWAGEYTAGQICLK